MMRNGDLPRWAVKALIWVLVSLLGILGIWISGVPALQARVAGLEESRQTIAREMHEMRVELKVGLKDLSEKLDRVIEREIERWQGRTGLPRE